MIQRLPPDLSGRALSGPDSGPIPCRCGRCSSTEPRGRRIRRSDGQVFQFPDGSARQFKTDRTLVFHQFINVEGCEALTDLRNR